MIHIENLVKRYGDLVALNHLNLDIHEGEIFGLLGPNGSGKTTAINCLLSLLKYDKGTIEVFGQPMTPESYQVKQQIGIVLQNVAVFDELTVYENIDYFCGYMFLIKNVAKNWSMRQFSLSGSKITVKPARETFWRSAATAEYCLRYRSQASSDHYG